MLSFCVRPQHPFHAYLASLPAEPGNAPAWPLDLLGGGAAGDAVDAPDGPLTLAGTNLGPCDRARTNGRARARRLSVCLS